MNNRVKPKRVLLASTSLATMCDSPRCPYPPKKGDDLLHSLLTTDCHPSCREPPSQSLGLAVKGFRGQANLANIQQSGLFHSCLTVG
jgi:hypothetical protein